MPLIPHTYTLIEVPVTNRVVNDTTIRQKAVFQSLTHRQERGESTVTVTVLVTLYAADGEGYGAPLIGNGFQPYRVELGAANDTIVDATNGAILQVNTQRIPFDEWQAVANAYEQPVMLQGDFFEVLRDSQPIEIGNMIRLHIAQADAMGKFA